jgi:hypothetical protein
MCFLPEFASADFIDNIYTLKSEEGEVTITYVDDQWIVDIAGKIFVVEKLGVNSRVTAY